MSAFAVAGGEIAPVEPVVESAMVVEEVPSVGNFYIGIGYGYEKYVLEDRNERNLIDAKFGSIMLNAGYKFNQYVAVEGRYWSGINSSNDLAWRGNIPSDITIDAWGLYVKPMFPVTNAMNIYGLVGYGTADATYDVPGGGSFTSNSSGGFSWGIGADYAITNNWAIFVDYTSVIEGQDGNLDNFDTDDSINVINFGVNYLF
jgi:opacity protein-like surface antigen